MVAETALSTVARKSVCGLASGGSVASGCVKHPIKDNAPARKIGSRKANLIARWGNTSQNSEFHRVWVP